MNESSRQRGHVVQLARHDLPGHSLIIEITKDLLLDNIDRTRNVLEPLRELLGIDLPAQAAHR
jgi:EAL domain-containing protein (putative c-di-GMP-specific phosphodiesterase class I)